MDEERVHIAYDQMRDEDLKGLLSGEDIAIVMNVAVPDLPDGWLKHKMVQLTTPNESKARVWLAVLGGADGGWAAYHSPPNAKALNKPAINMLARIDGAWRYMSRYNPVVTASNGDKVGEDEAKILFPRIASAGKYYRL